MVFLWGRTHLLSLDALRISCVWPGPSACQICDQWSFSCIDFRWPYNTCTIHYYSIPPASSKSALFFSLYISGYLKFIQEKVHWSQIWQAEGPGNVHDIHNASNKRRWGHPLCICFKKIFFSNFQYQNENCNNKPARENQLWFFQNLWVSYSLSKVCTVW